MRHESLIDQRRRMRRIAAVIVCTAILHGSASPRLFGDSAAITAMPAPPTVPAAPAEGKKIAVSQRQFQTDTGEDGSSRQVQIDQPLRVKVGEKIRRTLKLDLRSWPLELRSGARLWLAVSASSAITTEGVLHVGFEQAGVGMYTNVDNTFAIDGVMVFGCDYEVGKGEVTVEIDNFNHLSDLDCTVHAIAYVPRTRDPAHKGKE